MSAADLPGADAMTIVPSRGFVTSQLWQYPRVRGCLQGFVCAWFLASPAFAQPQLDWQAGAGCPSADEGRAQIEQLLRAPLAELAGDLSAAVHLRRDSESAFAATIEVRQAGLARTRVVRSTDCAVLAHTSAVIVALAIDPSARVDEPSAPVSLEDTPQDSGEAGTDPGSADDTGAATLATAAAASADNAARPNTPIAVAARSGTSTPRADERAPPAAEGGNEARLAPFLGGALGLDAGTLPKLAPRLALSVGLEADWARAALHFRYAPAQLATAVELPGLSGRVGLTAAAIEAGLHWQLAHLELASLAGLEAGVFAARGSGDVSDAASKHPLWLGGYLAGKVALRLNASLKLGLRLEGLVALHRPSFVLRSDLGENYTLYRSNLVSGRLWLELELHFPR